MQELRYTAAGEWAEKHSRQSAIGSEAAIAADLAADVGTWPKAAI